MPMSGPSVNASAPVNQHWRGFQSSACCPSPFGRRWRGAPDEGPSEPESVHPWPLSWPAGHPTREPSLIAEKSALDRHSREGGNRSCGHWQRAIPAFAGMTSQRRNPVRFRGKSRTANGWQSSLPVGEGNFISGIPEGLQHDCDAPAGALKTFWRSRLLVRDDATGRARRAIRCSSA
jgi:hypothetical protein